MGMYCRKLRVDQCFMWWLHLEEVCGCRKGRKTTVYSWLMNRIWLALRGWGLNLSKPSASVSLPRLFRNEPVRNDQVISPIHPLHHPIVLPHRFRPPPNRPLVLSSPIENRNPQSCISLVGSLSTLSVRLKTDNFSGGNESLDSRRMAVTDGVSFWSYNHFGP